MKITNILAAASLLLMSSCELDYTNTGAISPDNVWTDETMIDAFLTGIYGSMMPGWPGDENGTDLCMNNPTQMPDISRGIITVDNQGQNPGYGNINKINFFLEHIADNNAVSPEKRDRLKGQALFWRAWDYWGKVWNVGGVPLILEYPDVKDPESLFVPRNKTSECVAQILKDLDEAIALLPDTWTGSDYGRIDKGIAMAFKGRVLLQYASPLFNPSNDQARWKQAYDANKAAVDFLTSVGKGLYQGDFADIWYVERNCEVVMVNQFYYPDHTFWQNGIRPEPLTKDLADHNRALTTLLMAYPRKDGSKLDFQPEKLEDPAYNEQFMTDFYLNRDPRFYATVYSPGTDYPAADMLTDGRKFWNGWREIPRSDGSGYDYTSLTMDEPGIFVPCPDHSTDFYQFKGVDRSLTKNTVSDATTDWIEIRFAEVLMNYGEAANETGNASEALRVLYDIRKRAGIEAGSGNYGITATTQDDIRQAYLDERFIEFAYEGKRFADLRRTRNWAYLNNVVKYRSGLIAVIKDYSIIADGKFDWTKSMYDDDYRKLFKFVYNECVDNDKNAYKFDFSLDHWFYPLAQVVLDRNSKIEQNNEWGGTFNPLD